MMIPELVYEKRVNIHGTVKTKTTILMMLKLVIEKRMKMAVLMTLN